MREVLKALFAWEGTIEHPRWHTGSFWSQEDIRRYAEAHVRAENARVKAGLSPEPQEWPRCMGPSTAARPRVRLNDSIIQHRILL